MANYYIDIIDTVNDDLTTALELAKKRSIKLSHKGDDDKDALAIVGSSLSFVIIVTAANNTDGVFEHLFTGDETRFKVELRQEADDLLLWQGFILPDEYSEPYKAGTLDINVLATDGLGRLKGKFLADEFYTQKNKVTDIIAACLKLTGLNMPFYFNPSIENRHQPDYHKISIDGADLMSGGKKDDAYKILEYLAEDLLFCVYQSLGFWHLDGLNKRNVALYTTNHYDADGVFIETVERSRNVKDINNNILATPDVKSVVPYGLIQVSHEREPIGFLPTQTREVNDGWAVTTGVVPEIMPTQWINGIFPVAKAPNYNIIFPNGNNGTFQQGQLTSLKQKIYLTEGGNYKLAFELKVNDSIGNQNSNAISSWQDPIYYKVTFNDNTLFSNFDGDIATNEELRFINTKTKELAFEFIVPSNGLFDVIFYEPFKTGEAIESIELLDMSLEQIGAPETEVFTETINEDYTNVKEKELTFADDPSGYSKAFLLEDIGSPSAGFSFRFFPILYSFTQNGKHYSAVDLIAANGIAENRNFTAHFTMPSVEILDVIYNYQGNEQMLIETNTPDLEGVFRITIENTEQGSEDRKSWVEWTDSLYGVERLRFGDVHAKIYKRLFVVPHTKADLTLFNLPVSFNDILLWNYKAPYNYNITNIRQWDLDSGRTVLSMSRAIYQNNDGDTGTNIPPIVTVPEVLYLVQNGSSKIIESQSSDPDGFIVSRQWTETNGSVAWTTPNPNNNFIQVNDLTDDFYTFQITVTDNDGATASASCDVIRLRDYEITLTEVFSSTDNGGDSLLTSVEKHYDLGVSPALPDGFNLTIGGQYTIDFVKASLGSVFADVIIEKNTVELINDSYGNDNVTNGLFNLSLNTPFNFNSTDSVTIKLKARARGFAFIGTASTSDIDFDINTVGFATGDGNITTVLPLNVGVTAIWDDE